MSPARRINTTEMIIYSRLSPESKYNEE
jgi:hypothetical protein